MTIRGTLRADGLAVARITVDFLQNPVKVTSLAAFIDTQAGQTLGYCEGDGSLWSAETMKKLKELRESMEEDFARRVFSKGPGDTVTGTDGMVETGLGEHVGSVPDVPSV